jgi:hypothetical protein
MVDDKAALMVVMADTFLFYVQTLKSSINIHANNYLCDNLAQQQYGTDGKAVPPARCQDHPADEANSICFYYSFDYIDCQA